MFGKGFGGRTKKKKTTVTESYEALIADESDKLLDDESIVTEAIEAVENNGIVFLDEIDKIAVNDQRSSAGVSQTDHILFVASGAFHVSKPSDLLPELQGRLPIRVELRALEKDDFRRILTEPEASLVGYRSKPLHPLTVMAFSQKI